MGKYLVEFLGTFFLVLTVCLTAVFATNALAPLAIAAVLMAAIYAGGPVSGGHYNPAVSLAARLSQKLPPLDFLRYLLCQCSAAVAALYLASFLLPHEPLTALNLTPIRAAVAEALFTFLLAFVVLNVATVKAVAGNSYFGLAIGLVVLAGALAVGAISGGAFNPAVSLALALGGALRMPDLAAHLAGQCAGAFLAAGAFRAIHARTA